MSADDDGVGQDDGRAGIARSSRPWPTRGRYTLKRQLGGFGAFGHAEVELVARGGVRVRLAFDPAGYDDFVRGAVRGCSRALRELGSSRELGSTHGVELLDLHWMVVDTSESIMEVVGFLAVADALGVASRFEPARSADGTWRVRPRRER